MSVPEKRPRIDTDSCMHQCTKCGLMYDCGKPRCDRPFYSGVCARSAAFVHKAGTMFALS